MLIKISDTLSAKYYHEIKKDYKIKARERYQSFWRRKRKQKQQYGGERYKNRSEDEEQKLVAYRKKYYKMRKNT